MKSALQNFAGNGPSAAIAEVPLEGLPVRHLECHAFIQHLERLVLTLV